MIRLCLIVLLSMGCSGAKYDRGVQANAEAKAPVRVVRQPVDGAVTWFNVTIRAGTAHDPVGKEGLAWLTANLLREGGTTALEPDGVERTLYGMGTDIDVVVDRELVSFRVKCLEEDAAAAAKLLGEMIVEPRLDADTFERLRGESTSWLERGIIEDDEGLGQAVLETWLYAGHPYGHPLQGRLGVVGNLTVDDVREFLDSRYVRPVITVGVAGAISEPAVDALVSALGATPAELYRDVTPRPVQSVSGRNVLVVEKPTASTGIHMGHPTRLSRGHPDWPAMLLAVTAFGEHRQSHGWLYQALREERGLNYGDYAYIETYRQAGWGARQQTATGRVDNPFSVWLRPMTNDNAPFALKAAVDLVEKWSAEGLTEAEFKRIQSYLNRRIALWAEEPGRRLGWAVEATVMGWPDPIAKLPEQIRALDRATVNAAIERHIHPENLAIVVVTKDGAAFDSAVRGDAPTPVSYASSPPAADSEQAKLDVRFSEKNLGVQSVETIRTDALFR